ncbi:MAG: hypothetical protein WC390_08650 [Sulfurimonas sp.]
MTIIKLSIAAILICLLASCMTVTNNYYADNNSTINSTLNQNKPVNTTPSLTATIPESAATGITGAIE